MPWSLLVSATASAAEPWSANSSSKRKVKLLLVIACSIPAIHYVVDRLTFCVSKAWFAANHPAIYGIKLGVREV
jgi:hypothetical protein